MHCVVGAFILTFPILRILAYCKLCELCSQRYPNLLPVAGGGGRSPHSMRYCTVFWFLLYYSNPIPRAFGVYVFAVS